MQYKSYGALIFKQYFNLKQIYLASTSLSKYILEKYIYIYSPPGFEETV